MGWGEELTRLGDSSSIGRPENLSVVTKACQKELTEKGKFALYITYSAAL
jgi:hypothetical protein